MYFVHARSLAFFWQNCFFIPQRQKSYVWSELPCICAALKHFFFFFFFLDLRVAELPPVVIHFFTVTRMWLLRAKYR